jgi:endonuclease G, mitochondrial
MPKFTVTIPIKITVEIPEDTTPLPVLESADLERVDEEYYDEEQDLQDRDGYYSGVNLNASGDDLYRSLSKLVAKTHKKKLSYSPSKHLYPWVDLREDGELISIYSGASFSVEEFIQHDENAEAARRSELESIMALESFATDDLAGIMDALEASHPYNCEHVVPQSWFNKREPMRGDLHHLFSCEVRCNSFRGNLPFTEFGLEKVMEDCGESIGGKFEPLGGKSAVARATLYFLLRYPGEINNKQNEYTADSLGTLLSWAQQPVSEYEKHRNQAIFEKQGNRNPLIDFPELVDKINFRLGLGK